MNSDLTSVPKISRSLGIVVSILMVFFGIGVLMAPLFFVSIMIWIFVIGLMINGVFHIFDYARCDVKNGWTLTTGILAIILSILLIFAPTFSKAETFAFMLSFMALFTGINQIAASSVMKKLGGSGSGWLLTSGIINIILGFFFIFNPYVMLFTFSIIAGIYLIVGGIALFAATMSNQG
ncbi:MAG: HdeD family acid-resistance protein [Acetobacterium sp.]